jgi:hypothetical protein
VIARIWVNVVAILLAFVQAPFVHFHLHESTQKHSGSLFHVHLQHLSPHSSQPGFRGWDPDDDAQFQDWFSATRYHSAFTPVILTAPFITPRLPIARWSPPAITPSAHDPPDISARPPRAPPV